MALLAPGSLRAHKLLSNHSALSDGPVILFFFFSMESLKGSRDKELLHCSQCQAMTVGCILSFSNKRAAISVNLCRTGNTHNGIVPFIVISAGKRKP